jgi:hypothetical protein
VDELRKKKDPRYTPGREKSLPGAVATSRRIKGVIKDKHTHTHTHRHKRSRETHTHYIPIVLCVILFATLVLKLFPTFAVFTGGHHDDISAVVQMIKRIASF